MIFTKITDSETLAQIIIENLFNNTDKITKISEGSVIKGIANGLGKLGNKNLKDIAIIESRLFPDTSFGTYLDDVAARQGNIPRLAASGSSTYERIVGVPGTQYLASTHFFKSKNGIVFSLDEDVTIPSFGFTYAKLLSQTTGMSTQVDALTIDTVTPIPTGHLYCINEYKTVGGRDIEDDALFRVRVGKGINELANNTTSMVEQALIRINPRVLRAFHGGIDNDGNTKFVIITVDGGDLSPTEIETLTSKFQKIFTVTQFRPSNSGYLGIVLENINYLPIDIAFRIIIEDGFDVDNVRKNIQITINKYIDYRHWTGIKVDWTDLLEIVKSINGVKYVPDNYFTPNIDVLIPFDTLPRIRGFIMLDINGNILSSNTGTLNPVFYPNQPDLYLNSSVLNFI